MNPDQLNTPRSNIKYLLSSLFAVLEERNEERVFENEQFTISYDPINGLLVRGRNPSITVNHTGTLLPEEYTSTLQLPYEWIKSLINDLRTEEH